MIRTTLALLLFAAAVGCAGDRDITDATHVRAFNPEAGDATALTDADLANIEQHGVVMEFRSGDVVYVDFDVSGNVVTLAEASPVALEVKQHIFVYSGPDGLLVSEDGVRFQPMGKLMDGTLRVGLSVHDDRNNLEVKLNSTMKTAAAPRGQDGLASAE